MGGVCSNRDQEQQYYDMEEQDRQNNVEVLKVNENFKEGSGQMRINEVKSGVPQDDVKIIKPGDQHYHFDILHDQNTKELHLEDLKKTKPLVNAKIETTPLQLGDIPPAPEAIQLKQADYKDGSYRGEMNKDGQRQGRGTHNFKEQDTTFVGEWKDDKANGRGIMNQKDNSVYLGKFNQNKGEGEGVIFHGEGAAAAGNWQNGRLHNYGVYSCNEYTYQGEYQNGLRHGYGFVLFSDGSQYAGQWEDDMIQGYGLYQWSNGTSYQGDFKQGLRDGYGVQEDSQHLYQGQFFGDRFNGYGTRVNKINGDRRKATWKAGKADGISILETKDSTYVQLMSNGEVKKTYNDNHIQDSIYPEAFIQQEKHYTQDMDQKVLNNPKFKELKTKCHDLQRLMLKEKRFLEQQSLKNQ